MTPRRVKVRALRADLAQVIASVRQDPVVVVNHGEPVAALISVEAFAEYTRLRGVYTNVSPFRRKEQVPIRTGQKIG